MIGNFDLFKLYLGLAIVYLSEHAKNTFYSMMESLSCSIIDKRLWEYFKLNIYDYDKCQASFLDRRIDPVGPPIEDGAQHFGGSPIPQLRAPGTLEVEKSWSAVFW